MQAYSVNSTNFSACTSFLDPRNRIMGSNFTSGGHLPHGIYPCKTMVSASSIYFESFPDCVDQVTGIVV